MIKVHQKMMLTGCFAVGLAACAPADGTEAASLADLTVTDPNFTFENTRTVSLELQVAGSDTPRAIEVADAEGRRLMQGAFVQDAALDLKVPVGRASTLQVRSGQGANATVQQVDIDANGRAISTVR